MAASSAGVIPATLSPPPDRKGGFTHTPTIRRKPDRVLLGRIFQRWELSTAPEQGPAYANPTLILAGRQDASVGYAAAWRLLEHYPRATFAVVDRAGHALLHEQVGLATALLGEWLDRVGERRTAGPVQPGSG